MTMLKTLTMPNERQNTKNDQSPKDPRRLTRGKDSAPEDWQKLNYR
jgi:hypothetical protein